MVAVPLLVLIIGWSPPWLFAAFIVALILRAQWELYRMFQAAGVGAHAGPGLAAGALVGLAFAWGGPARPGPVLLALTVAILGCLTVGLRPTPGRALDWAAVALTLLGVCYCAWLLGHAVWLRELPGGRRLIFFLLAVTWAGETAAYIVGRRWGRRPLAPRLSPRKTVEGALAQLVVSVAVGVGLAALARLEVGPALGMAALLGVVAQVGDLAESFLKRAAGTKDAGALLPGHGGLLDRLDSLLFNVPALYYCLAVSASMSGMTQP